MVYVTRPLTVKEVAKRRRVSRQAIKVAIREGRLKATKNKSRRWIINLSDLKEFEKNKYSRDFSKVDGVLLFDKEQDLYSATEAAKVLGCDRQHIYHALRTNKLAHRKRHNHRWVIHWNDIVNYQPVMRLYKKQR